MTKYLCLIVICLLYLHFETADGSNDYIESIETEELEEVITEELEEFITEELEEVVDNDFEVDCIQQIFCRRL